MSRYICFEGLDFSGKTTLLNMLAEDLIAKGYNVMKVREPGETDLGREIRTILLDSDYELSELNQAYLFATDRSFTLEKVRKFLSEDEMNIVLSDRSFVSSLAYQPNHGENANLANMQLLEEYDIHPDVIFIDSTYSQFLERRGSRDSIDNIEKLITEEKHESISSSFKHIIEFCIYISTHIIVDSDLSLEQKINYIKNNIKL